MNSKDFGNRLNEIVNQAQMSLANQSELAQLTYKAFEIAIRQLDGEESDSIQITFPIGFSAENQPIPHTRTYTKQEVLARYHFLGRNFLAINAIFHLVTLIEAMTADLLRAILSKYPQKLSADKKISLGDVLGASSIEIIHARAIDAVLNELSYKTPSEFGESISKLMSINILECPAYHMFVELKATRDVYMHNRGFANDVYVRKAWPNARVRAGEYLPADVTYFLKSFEQCYQLCEWLEERLHDKWPSSSYEAQQDRAERGADPAQLPPSDATSKQLRELAVKLAKPSSGEGGGT